MTQNEKDLLQSVRETALTKLQELLSSGTLDPTQVAFISTAYNKVAKAQDLSVIADGLLQVAKLQQDVETLRGQVASATTGGFIPVLVRIFQNGADNNWRVKPHPFTDFTDEAGLFTQTNFQTLAIRLRDSYAVNQLLHTTGGFYYEQDIKTYNNSWNDYNGIVSVWFLKNDTQEDLTVNLTVIHTSGDWAQHHSSAIANGIVLHKLTSNTTPQTFNHQFTVPAGASKFPVAVFTGAYRWGCWYGCEYVIRHFVKMDLPNGVSVDIEAYKQVGGIA